MEIIETAVFTRRIQAFCSDDEYRELQLELIARPDSGKIIKGSGGVRKLRWSFNKSGKRGGLRIIYYWFVDPKKLLFLFAYPKSEQDDLSKDQLHLLKRIVQEEYHEKK